MKTKRFQKFETCGKRRGGSFGGKLPPSAGVKWGDVPRQKLTQGQLRKHKPKPQVSVPHLGDLHKIPSLGKPVLLAGLRKKDKDVAKAPD